MVEIKYGLNEMNRGTNTSNDVMVTPSFIPVRVKHVILTDTDLEFDKFGKWNSIGIIKWVPVYNESYNDDITSMPFAKPFNSNIKKFPLINEIVYIVSLPDNSTQGNNTTINYYIDVINIWNHPHHNALPKSGSTDTNYSETESGTVRKLDNESTDIFLGNTFNEKSNIHPLLPFEGDLLLEGRWGQSIRFGSTVKDKNSWSKNGENGDPILIMRNGQGPQTQYGWVPVVEDINNDDSSIYFTTNQTIPIKVASTNMGSFSTNVASPTKQIDKSNQPVSKSLNIFNENDISTNFPGNIEDLLSDVEEIQPDLLENDTISLEEQSLTSETKFFFKINHQIQKSKTWCLIASVSMLLKFMNLDNSSQESISKYNDSNGSLQINSLAKNFKLIYSKIDIPGGVKGMSAIKDYITKYNHPLILEKRSISDPSDLKKSHFVVVTGVDNEDNLIIHDPSNIKGINNILKAKVLKPIGSIRILR